MNIGDAEAVLDQYAECSSVVGNALWNWLSQCGLLCCIQPEMYTN